MPKNVKIKKRRKNCDRYESSRQNAKL